MARAGETLEHPITKERIVWRQVARDTCGRMLEADLYVGPGGFVAAEHIHPKQEERFEVLAGTIKMRLHGKEMTLDVGARAVVPAGAPHVWWNAGTDEARVRGAFVPALRTEMFFETFFGWAKDRKTNARGLPNPFRLAVLMREYRNEIRLARPPAAVQAVVFGLMAVVGRLMGYRGWDSRYSAEPLADPAHISVHARQGSS